MKRYLIFGNFRIKSIKFVNRGNTLTKFKNLGGVNMRREPRRREEKQNNNMLYIGGSIILIGIIAFVATFILYGNKMDKQAKLDNQRIASLVQGGRGQSEEVSSQMGKTVEESKSETQNTITTKTETKSNTTKKETTAKQNTAKKTQNTNTVKKEETVKTNTENKSQETKAEALTFTRPIEGELLKDYAKEKLLYSETLEEWTTHLGWDIKADKTAVVKSSANGKVKSIKNDPRYGLSVIVEHADGYETLYANLLSTEFVTVGEEIKQGQSIGTVGNTAAFEIADETHLHFEITKNGESIDPNTLIK